MTEKEKEELINRYLELVKFINAFEPYDAMTKFLKVCYTTFISYLNGEEFDIFKNINKVKIRKRKYKLKIFPNVLYQIKHLMDENYDIEDICLLVSLSKTTIYKNITRIITDEELENYFKRRKNIKKDYKAWCERKRQQNLTSKTGTL